MANNRFQIRRSSVAGKIPTTSDLNIGELGLNLTDQILYSTNGSVVFEVGANNTNAQVSNTLTVKAISANGGNGAAGEVLTSNGTGTYWSSAAGGANYVYMKGGTATYGTLGVQGENIFRVNANTLNNDTTIAAGENAQATGPLTVAVGKTLTVQTGGRVAII